jgi:5,10-methylenetetrahydromethanopterin reductase
MKTMKLGLGVGELAGSPATIDDVVGQVQAAERDGFASAWFANIFGIDAITACALAGRETRTIELGTAVVPTYPRHPTAMAQQALTASAACRGRFSLGIGLSHQVVIEMMFGLSFAKPFTHMREYMAVLRPLLETGSASFAGEEFRINSQLSVAGATPPPILIAALAPKMLALAGSEAAGTITWMTGPKTLREHTIPRLSEAAARAGRPKPRVVCGLPVCVTDDAEAARRHAGQAFQIYGSLPSYRSMMDREGVEGPAQLAVVGDEAAVEEQLARLEQIGVTDFLAAMFPVGDAPASIARTRALLVELAR